MKLTKCCNYVPQIWKSKRPGILYLYMIRCEYCLRVTHVSVLLKKVVKEWDSFFIKPKKKGPFLIAAEKAARDHIKKINQMRKHFGI